MRAFSTCRIASHRLTHQTNNQTINQTIRRFIATPVTSKQSVVGSTITNHLRLNDAHIGQVIEPPYETTFNDGVRAMWQSSFYGHDRIHTSRPFGLSLGLSGSPFPFSMMLFATISMSHVDESRSVLDLEYSNACYVRPAYSNDTFTQSFTIQSLRNTSDGINSVVQVHCELLNQRGQVVFNVDKTMLYPGVTHPFKTSSKQKNDSKPAPRSHLLEHILFHGDSLANYETINRSNNLSNIQTGQLILHSQGRPLGASANMGLSTLFRWTHPSIYRLQAHNQPNSQSMDQSNPIHVGTSVSDNQPIVPGGLVLASTLSAASGGFFEVLHEQIDSCCILNKVAPNDTIHAMSYVSAIKPLKEGFEELTVTTLGVKHLDVKQFEGKKLPLELFTVRMRPSEMEAFCATECPALAGHIVVQVCRKIVRQSQYSGKQAIPLL